MTLLREAGRPNVYLEGQQNLLNYAELADSFRTLMEFFSDTEAVKRYVSPKSERTTVLLGDELPTFEDVTEGRFFDELASEALSRGRRADGGHRHRRSNAHALPGNDPAA